MRRCGVVLITLGVTLAGCGDAPSDAPATRHTAPPTTTTSVEDAVLAAYYAYWNAFNAAADPPNPDHPELVRWTTGRELAEIQALLENDREVGLVRRGKVDLDPVVVSVNGDTAEVRDCYWDRGGVYVAESGQVIEPPARAPTSAAFLLKREGSRWKVSEQHADLEAPCDALSD